MASILKVNTIQDATNSTTSMTMNFDIRTIVECETFQDM